MGPWSFLSLAPYTNSSLSKVEFNQRTKNTKDKTNFSDYVDQIHKLAEKYSGFYKLWMGPQLVYVVAPPEHTEVILNSPHALDKSQEYNVFHPAIGQGIFTANGAYKDEKNEKLKNIHFVPFYRHNLEEATKNHVRLSKSAESSEICRYQLETFPNIGG